ncbi:hypothetical protein CKO40_09360 [Halochromatium glycolicum]|uniref:Uncharacterized protein n=1 Tax=Halochromatium glycolicum TaxID=85075 RepID=A0AAJ0U3S5_9GAMM|nr:hypothetical protein [Halochromatium glycolicum]
MAAPPLKPSPRPHETGPGLVLVRLRLCGGIKALRLRLRLRLRLQGQLALRRLLAQHGGTLSVAEVAELLGITPDAVRKRARCGGLLALPHGCACSAYRRDSSGIESPTAAIRMRSSGQVRCTG